MDRFEKRMKKIKILSISLISIITILFIKFVIDNSENVITGMYNIITSPSILITDFLLVGGIGAAFLNAFFIFFFNYTIVRLLKIKVNGIIIASFFTVFGFSFFGKNILNIMPFYLGGIMYSAYSHTHFKDNFVTISFASALAPFVSEIAFSVDTYDTSYINAILLGLLIGFIIVPLSQKMFSFHEGYNLYNLGFTGGIVGAVITSVLKLYEFNIEPQRLISVEFDTALKIICSLTFISLVIIGFFINENSFNGYNKLIQDPGLKVDFIEKYGYGLTFINMGVMGFVAMLYPLILGQTLNGPLLAGILTVVGFSAYGKTFINIIPILVGVYIAQFGSSVDSFTIALSGLFGTALAPIAGMYGPLAGIIAGWLHLSVVQSIGIVHGGLNLYNNGFSAGIVASFMLPIIRMIVDRKSKEHLTYMKKQRAIRKAVIHHYKELTEENMDINTETDKQD